MRCRLEPLFSLEMAAFCIKIDCLRELRQSCSLTPNTEISRTISRRDTHVVFGKKNYMALHLDDIMGVCWLLPYYHWNIPISTLHFSHIPIQYVLCVSYSRRERLFPTFRANIPPISYRLFLCLCKRFSH